LRDLRRLIKMIRTRDQKVDVKYALWQKAQQKGRKLKLQRELAKLSAHLQEMFPRFAFKQKVAEEMIVVAGNVHEKFKASCRLIEESSICGLPPSAGRPLTPNAPRFARSNSSSAWSERIFTSCLPN